MSRQLFDKDYNSVLWDFPPSGCNSHLAFSICFLNQYIPFHVSIALYPKSPAIDNRNTVSGT